MSVVNLFFDADAVCIAVNDTMIPGFGYQDINYETELDLPPGYNPLGEDRTVIEEVSDEWVETGEVKKFEVKRAPYRAAEASDFFGTEKKADRNVKFTGIAKSDPDADVIDLTDRAPRQPMPEVADETAAGCLTAAAMFMIRIRARLILLAKQAEGGGDLAKSQEVRDVFTAIEREARELAYLIEPPE